MTQRFTGKVALVTGGASGMGRAITIRLADEGASVLAADISVAGLEETASLASGSVATRVADVSDPESCADLVTAAVGEFGGLDVLGNVAGILLAGHATEISVEDYRRVMGVNLDGYFFLAQQAIPHLLEREGNIVNIASNAGLQGVPYAVAYNMSKGGVIQLTRGLAVEFLTRPLRVNAIAPAGTRTNIAVGATFPADMDPALAVRMAGLRGMAEPEEVAALFAFLASDEARSITGAIYTIDNGITAS
jgi:NAD(P)-dependent dehydrogenase (short-subunit alcohol dehydrogenase family)